MLTNKNFDMGFIIQKELQKAHKHRSICGVYFLIQLRAGKEVVVYIGKSYNVFKRVAAHTYKYDYFKIIKVEKKSLDLVERFLISKFLPEFNKDPITRKIREEQFNEAYMNGEFDLIEVGEGKLEVVHF